MPMRKKSRKQKFGTKKPRSPLHMAKRVKLDESFNKRNYVPTTKRYKEFRQEHGVDLNKIRQYYKFMKIHKLRPCIGKRDEKYFANKPWYKLGCMPVRTLARKRNLEDVIKTRTKKRDSNYYKNLNKLDKKEILTELKKKYSKKRGIQRVKRKVGNTLDKFKKFLDRPMFR